jgi:hypothetical protein
LHGFALLALLREGFDGGEVFIFGVGFGDEVCWVWRVLSAIRMSYSQLQGRTVWFLGEDVNGVVIVY